MTFLSKQLLWQLMLIVLLLQMLTLYPKIIILWIKPCPDHKPHSLDTVNGSTIKGSRVATLSETEPHQHWVQRGVISGDKPQSKRLQNMVHRWMTIILKFILLSHVFRPIAMKKKPNSVSNQVSLNQLIREPGFGASSVHSLIDVLGKYWPRWPHIPLPMGFDRIHKDVLWE